MRTYAESRNNEPFNWFKALKEKDIDWENLNSLASNWVTCACGNLCDIIPREVGGEPTDKILSELGGPGGFYGAIEAEEAELALDYLELIELRSTQLIKRLKNDTTNPSGGLSSNK